MSQVWCWTNLTELLVSFLDLDCIVQQFKSRLVGIVLHDYLSLRPLVVQLTGIVDETREKLLELLVEIISGKWNVIEILYWFSTLRIFTYLILPVPFHRNRIWNRSVCGYLRQNCQKMQSERCTNFGIYFRTIVLLVDYLFRGEQNLWILFELERDPQLYFLRVCYWFRIFLNYLKWKYANYFDICTEGCILENSHSSNEPGFGPSMRDDENKIDLDYKLMVLLEDDVYPLNWFVYEIDQETEYLMYFNLDVLVSDLQKYMADRRRHWWSNPSLLRRLLRICLYVGCENHPGN